MNALFIVIILIEAVIIYYVENNLELTTYVSDVVFRITSNVSFFLLLRWIYIMKANQSLLESSHLVKKSESNCIKVCCENHTMIRNIPLGYLNKFHGQYYKRVLRKAMMK